MNKELPINQDDLDLIIKLIDFGLNGLPNLRDYLKRKLGDFVNEYNELRNKAEEEETTTIRQLTNDLNN